MKIMHVSFGTSDMAKENKFVEDAEVGCSETVQDEARGIK